MAVKEKLQEHLLDKLIHQDKYNHVMEQILVTRNEKVLKNHLSLFIQKKDELPLSNYMEKSKNIFSNTNDLMANDVTALLRHQTKAYNLLDLGCVPTMEHTKLVTNFIEDKGTAITMINSSIENFLNQAFIKNLPFFNEMVIKMAKIFFLKVYDAIHILNLLLDQHPGMELFSAIAMHPFLFYGVGPVIFFNLALPLLTPGNFKFLLKAIRAYCLSLISIVDGFTPSSSILREPLNYGPLIVQKFSDPFFNVNGGKNSLQSAKLTSNGKNVVGYWPKPIVFGLLSITIWQVITNNVNLVNSTLVHQTLIKITDVLKCNFVFDYIKGFIKK
jgi:hypothetical protein